MTTEHEISPLGKAFPNSHGHPCLPVIRCQVLSRRGSEGPDNLTCWRAACSRLGSLDSSQRVLSAGHVQALCAVFIQSPCILTERPAPVTCLRQAEVIINSCRCCQLPGLVRETRECTRQARPFGWCYGGSCSQRAARPSICHK